jgi:PKD repeat protein
VSTRVGAGNLTFFQNSSEVYDPASGQWKLSGIMSTGRDEFSGLLLDDGRVMISGGFVSPGAVLLNTVEIYTPGLTPQINGLYNVVGDLPDPAYDRRGRETITTLIGNVKSKVDTLQYAKALEEAQKLLVKVNEKVLDPAARARLANIVGVLINSLIDKISPNLPPTVAPVATPTAGVEPLLVNFTGNAVDSDGTIVYTLWNFGDFTTSNDPNPSHTYKCDGTYKVTLEVADDRGAVASASVTVTVSSAGGPVTYDCDVQPVFNRVCTGCHGAARGLSLTTCEGLELGSSPYPNRKVVIPGDAASSILYQRITSTTAPMPPVGGLLPVSEQNAIRDWINSLTPGNYDYCE